MGTTISTSLEILKEYAACLKQTGSNRYPFIVFATKVHMITIEFEFNGVKQTIITTPLTQLCSSVEELRTTHTPYRKLTFKLFSTTVRIDFPTGKEKPVHFKVSHYYYEVEINGERVNVWVTNEDIRKNHFFR